MQSQAFRGVVNVAAPPRDMTYDLKIPAALKSILSQHSIQDSHALTLQCLPLRVQGPE